MLLLHEIFKVNSISSYSVNVFIVGTSCAVSVIIAAHCCVSLCLSFLTTLRRSWKWWGQVQNNSRKLILSLSHSLCLCLSLREENKLPSKPKHKRNYVREKRRVMCTTFMQVINCYNEFYLYGPFLK